MGRTWAQICDVQSGSYPISTKTFLEGKVLSEEQKPATNPSQIPEKQAKNNNNKGNINYFHWIFRSDRMIVISTQKRT